MLLSDQFKDAFKIALAMVITYGIALSLDWEKPFWAGLSVAFCSLATTGESISRGIHRVVGTLLAGAATLMLMALFPQERWLFLLAMSMVIAFCTYRLSSGSRYFFIWFAAGFNIPILAILGDGLAINSFDIVILRVQETTLGVVVYTLVAILLWPRLGGTGFEAATRRVCDAQYRLFGRYIRMMTGKTDDGSAEPLHAELAGQLAKLGGQLEGAVYDSADIRRGRRTWRRCLGVLSELSTALENLRQGGEELRELDLQQFIPGLNLYRTELESRLVSVGGMLSGQAPRQRSSSVDLRLDRDALGTLHHFQRAAIWLCRDHLARIDELTQELFDTVSYIRGFGGARLPVRASTATAPSRAIDMDRLGVTVRQSAALWLTLLMAIYIPDFPNVVGVVALANAFAMILATVPHVQPVVFLLPAVTGTVFGGVLYLFVMPHLSGFGELGAMIFASTFLIGYVFHRPQAAVTKSMWLCMLVILIGVENQQTYSFLYFANWFIAGIFFVLTLMVAWRFPVSFRPEDRFLAMLERFHRSAGVLLSASCNDPGRKGAFLTGWRKSFHLHEVAVLPQRLRAWSGALPAAALGNKGRGQVQSLLNNLQVLSDRIHQLLDAESAAQSSILAQELLQDMHDWRSGVQDTLRQLSTAPETVNYAQLRSRLEAIISRLEVHVDGTLNIRGVTDGQPGNGDNLYRLLGAYRGFSEVLVELAGLMYPINWANLRESRF